MKVDGFNYHSWKFPAGELGVRITNDDLFTRTKTIALESGSSDEIMTAMLLADAIKRLNSDYKVSVVPSYLPYSRQDRACTEGEPASSHVLCKMLYNDKNIDFVFTVDVHSENSIPEGFRDKITNIPLELSTLRLLFSHIINEDPVYLLPDKGAYKKYKSMLEGCKVVHAEKVRDPETGYISKIEVHNKELLKGKNVIVVDDICDGGGTFIGLAKEIQYLPRSLHLFVTHGIFSKGTDELNKHYDSILYLNKVKTYV